MAQATAIRSESVVEQIENPCGNCHGKGAVTLPVLWSDGWGMCDHTCGVCDGSGKAQDLHRALIAAKKERNEAASELNALKVHLALYLSIMDTGGTPQPPLAGATGPSPYASTWREYLDKAIANLPRVQS